MLKKRKSFPMFAKRQNTQIIVELSKTIRLAYLFLGIGIILSFSACQDNRVYEQNIDLKNGQWYIDSVLTFQFKIEDAQSKYDFLYNIRNSVRYPYYNMYVTFYLEDSLGNVIDQELQNITLMDSRTGEPFGSGLGDIFSHQLNIPRLTAYKFPDKGTYTLKLKQYMRQDPLPEILSLGLRVEKSDR